MNQLILDVTGQNLYLPESQRGGYSAKEEPLTQDVQMISGRTAREHRGKVWVITYQYGYLNDEEKDRFLAACRTGLSRSIVCSFIPDGEDAAITSTFLVTSFTPPKFMWSRGIIKDSELTSVPVWGDYSVTLREVRPHA